jgi:two-component system response regulator NreC
MTEAAPVSAEPNAAHPAWITLSPREVEVALMLARGDANREIAKALGISIKTVDTHRGHVLKKMKLKNNVALALWCVRAGLPVAP